MAKWIQRTTDANIELMAKTLNVQPVVAAAMANRGVRSRNQAVVYLCPDAKHLHDPALLKDMERAAGVAAESIAAGEKIAVYGDYDVDGITGTVILYKTLAERGADVMYYIPHREHEGYGLNPLAVERLTALGVGLVITVDNGAASAAEIAMFAEAGIKVVVIDHHESQDAPPVMVNPKRDDCGYPFKHLCACGLAYKFAQYFYGYVGAKNPFDDEFLIFTAIATFCDVVDLQGENRVLAKLGLKLLNGGKCKNIGLNALIAARQMEDNEIGAFEIGFVIGPCINAAGRLDAADLAVDLFLTNDADEAARLANRLVVLNDERKTLTANSVELILEELRRPERDGEKILVLFKPEIHESIAGIVAGRVKEAVNKPTVVLTRGKELAKGSARSIEACNIFDELSKHKRLFERFGGHAMAAGLSLKEENIDELRRLLNENSTLTDGDFEPVIYYDGELELSGATFDLAQQLALLKPFGKANHEPIFVTRCVTAENIELIGKNKTTIRFTFVTQTPGEKNAKKRWLKGICFGKAEKLAAITAKDGHRPPLNIIYSLEINEFNGNVSVQLNIKDFTLS